jgi:hypothetical protein
LQAQIDESKGLDAPLARNPAGIAGNVAANIAESFVPGGVAVGGLKALSAAPAIARAASALGPAIESMTSPTVAAMLPGAAAGATLGAAQPTATGESAGMNALEGAAGGAVGALVPRVLGQVIKPGLRDDAKTLIDAGVSLTPGRALGGAAQRLEEGVESIPVVGDAIRGAQRRAIDDFNRAAYNRVLLPLGESVDGNSPVGHEGISMLESKLGNAYDSVLDKIKRVDLDNLFEGHLGKINEMVQQLPDDIQKQYSRIVQANIFDRATPAGTMSADTMKVAESELGRAARGYRGSDDFDKRQLGDAISEVQAALRSAVARSAPEYADQLQAVNQAYSNFVRVQDAASRTGSKDGVFSPATLIGATRKADNSVRKGAFARGNAPMQDLAEAGRNVLGATVPDSGTPFRLLATLGSAGAAGATLGGPLAAVPLSTLAAAGAGTLPYTKLGGMLTLAALAKRPQSASMLADLLSAGSPIGGVVGAGMGLPSLNGQ